MFRFTHHAPRCSRPFHRQVPPAAPTSVTSNTSTTTTGNLSSLTSPSSSTASSSASIDTNCSKAPTQQSARHVFWTGYESRSTRDVLAEWRTASWSALSRLQEQFDVATGLAQVERVQREIRSRQDAVHRLRLDVRRRQREHEGAATALSSVRSQLEPVAQRDPRYLTLTTRLVELLELDAACAAQVKTAEVAEREAYALLTRLVVESHALERTSADRMKAWGLLLSLAGTLAGFLGSSLMYRRRQREIRQLIERTDSSIGGLSPRLDTISTTVAEQQSRFGEMKEHVVAVFEEQTDAIARLLMQQKLGELMSDGTGIGAAHGDGGQASANMRLSEEHARRLGEAISLQMAERVHHVLQEHTDRMHGEFEAMKSQVSNDSSRLVAAAIAGGDGGGGRRAKGSAQPAAPVGKETPSVFDRAPMRQSDYYLSSDNMALELLAVSLGLALVLALHTVAGI